MPDYDRLIIYFHRASRSNPRGRPSCGWALYKMDENGANGKIIGSGYYSSSNQAGYTGVEAALEFMRKNDIRCDNICVRKNSEMTMNQHGSGSYQVGGSYIKEGCVTKELGNVKKQRRLICIPHFRDMEADNLTTPLNGCGTNSFST